MLKHLAELEKQARKGNAEAAYKYNTIMEALKTMDSDRIANCIITMKELIPELDNQSALLIKKYVIDPDRSLEYLSKDEIELINFLRENLKEDISVSNIK